MKYSNAIDTADFSNCVNSGWKIKISPSLIRFKRISRWRGNRSGDTYLFKNDGDTSEQHALNRAEDLKEILANGALMPKRGDSYRGFRCIDAGYVVR